nr:transposase [Micrococcus endophyticus]
MDRLDDYPTLTAACRAVGDRLGIGKGSLRRWARQAQVDAGECEGASSSEQERFKQLERENRDLREANAILKDAAVFFAGELTPDATDPRIHRGPVAQGRSLGSICTVLREQGVPVGERT